LRAAIARCIPAGVIGPTPAGYITGGCIPYLGIIVEATGEKWGSAAAPPGPNGTPGDMGARVGSGDNGKPFDEGPSEEWSLG